MPRNQQQKQLLEKWYLPHHGVYHPNKPGKIKVVFYLGEDFNGRSGTGLKVSKNVHGEEVLPSKDGGPFTFRTPLGWSVVGALTKLGRESSISCNQIVALDIATRK